MINLVNRQVIGISKEIVGQRHEKVAFSLLIAILASSTAPSEWYTSAFFQIKQCSFILFKSTNYLFSISLFYSTEGCRISKYIETSDVLHNVYLAEKLCFWTGIIFIGVYVSVCVSVCVCVCESLYRLSQKVLDRF